MLHAVVCLNCAVCSHIHYSALPLATHDAVWVLPLMVGWFCADCGKESLSRLIRSVQEQAQNMFLSMFLIWARFVMVHFAKVSDIRMKYKHY